MFFRIGNTKIAVAASAILSSFSLAPMAMASNASELEMQRDVYDRAQEVLDNRDLEAYSALRNKIQTYPLTPYTDYRAFLLGLGDRTPAEVDAFIEENKALPFSNRMRAPYLDLLAVQKQWKTILEFQTKEPVGEKYQCIYYRANYEQGNKELAFKGAKQLWLSGSGVDDSCDPLFESWDEAGLRTDELILQRMLLAFDKRNGKLMTYLIKQLDHDESIAQAKQMKALYNKPENVLAFAKKHPANEFYQAQTEFGFEKLARKSASSAQEVFDDVVKAQKFSKEKSQELADYLTFRLINTDSEELMAWRDKMLASSSKQVLLERRARLAIQHADWTGLKEWIARLDDKHQASLRWQYWQGRAEIALGDTAKGNKRLSDILGQRNFYSVAAAKQLGKPVQYPTSTLKYNAETVKPFETSLVRIGELIDRDKIAAAKSEWRWLLTNADKDQKSMLAAHAATQRWNHFTVTASISAKMWDNIDLRFPVAHKWWFNFYAEKHDIDPITLMSLARQESAMDSEARSPVGARGIMQIMPKTAQYTANKHKIKYQGSDDLYDVGKNIEIGSHYLDGLLAQYDNNRIFAFAAYNAGPSRVKQWRSRSDEKLDAFAFIEMIPFKETRGYVQNILMFETYYRDILGEKGMFLAPHEAETKY
ncbi:murein transglycosylase [Vibrio splendidus]|uniref:murein transglycosylase n=1 Tax=Vibrio splendidus TaxID=29497 RepID=UPI001C00331C|nr:murein transglycosylase [Vibrio splendidus]MBT9240129.1 murein transglycosylase [Vibrio splendidus]MDH5911877.1 murein transglycosylase [Vibrio splendidus]MDH5943113.1 murein transglycosylase [Vibrio splendidus]MDH5986319.1 murein transglycosylase [Vibrio splendidus]MDH5994690.1 murein transglycosylase [Vibrio splendidus]